MPIIFLYLMKLIFLCENFHGVLAWFSLVVFYDQSSLVHYSMPNPVYIYIIQWNLGYQMTLRSNNSGFNQNI